VVPEPRMMCLEFPVKFFNLRAMVAVAMARQNPSLLRFFLFHRPAQMQSLEGGG
jgi:hypothetical protein